MAKSNQMATITSVALLLSACSSPVNPSKPSYQVIYDTEPQGAALICNNENRGYTPVALSYDVKYDPEGENLLNPEPCQAIWSSGVQLAFPTPIAIFPEGAARTVLPRPKGAGYAQDAEFALKVKALKATQSAIYSQSLANAAIQQRANYSSLPSLPSMQNNSFQNNTIHCKNIAVSLSSEIKTFSGTICPIGWMQAY